MRCKECGQTKRGPRKELRDVQLCGDCYNRRKNLKKDEVEHSERYKNWMRKNDLKRKMPKSNQLPDENNLDVRPDKAKSKPKEDEIPKSDELQRFEKALERQALKFQKYLMQLRHRNNRQTDLLDLQFGLEIQKCLIMQAKPLG